ncbi:hypothetical protein HK100_001935 [Physocladia obscura]|uniref:BTB domain-containing protein n=1 Tax=Physocladia obscura TaxID=109957 RepID=A0AAD5XEJ1_9FUNG|nr:hypothetical protein HK100_001935 [Physocladia obscura]
MNSQHSRRASQLHTQEAFTANAADQASAFNSKMRTNNLFSDVILVVGSANEAGHELVFAHAAVLAQRSEFYARALSPVWVANNRDDFAGIKLPPSLPKTQFRAIIRHPDCDLETINIILDYMYAGSAKIPNDVLVRVALFANQLLLQQLSADCLARVQSHGISVANAIEVWFSCDKLFSGQAPLQTKTRCLQLVKQSLLETMEAGRNHLSQVPSEDLSLLLTYNEFTSSEKWILLLGWAKARQNIKDLSHASKLPQEFNVAKGFEDISKFLVIAEIFSIGAEKYSTEIIPYLQLIPPELHRPLEFRFSLAPTNNPNANLFRPNSNLRF